MKKEVPNLDDFDDFEPLSEFFDYKMHHLNEVAMNIAKSTRKWIYLGADSDDNRFAKIGLTMDDLRSRSYSTSRPTYHIFCAFKCLPGVSKPDLKCIEKDLISRMDISHRNDDGSSKRILHHDSKKPSECFYPISFLDFFEYLHQLIHDHHRACFSTTALDDGAGGHYGSMIECLFNPRIELPLQHRYRQRILQD